MGYLNSPGPSEEFTRSVERNIKLLGSTEWDYFHAAAGCVTEAGELMDIAKTNLAYDKPLDFDHIIEELGDLLWYAEAVRLLVARARPGLSWSEVEQRNMEKLAKRYPQGRFTEADALARADKA